MNYRPDIDGLRTIAVVPVVLYHVGMPSVTGGFVGVDVFFVISGYLITIILSTELQEGRFSLLSFYERRARRILPALFTVLLASLTTGWLLLSPDAYNHMGQSALSTLLFVSNFFFWQFSGGYFGTETDFLPLLHTWSLAVEEQFYIFFPLLLMALYRIGRKSVVLMVLVLAAGSLALAVWATPRMPNASFYLLPTRAWELGLGALLALGVTPASSPRWLREMLAALGLLCIIVPIFIYDGNTTFPGLMAIPPVLGAALIIWVGSTGSSLTGRLLSLRPMVFIGLLSYSLYLWHWPIMAFARGWLFEVELGPIWQVGTVALSFVAGFLSWRFVERPFRSAPGNGRKAFSCRGIFVGSAWGAAVLGVLAGLVILTGGAAQRFTPEQFAQLSSITSMPRGNECFGIRPINRLCNFGNRDLDLEPSWVLWGDSHAKSMLPVFDELARKQGRKLLFASVPLCAPLIGAARQGVNARKFIGCVEFSRRVLGLIEKTPSIEHVFLAARWPLYVEAVRPEGPGTVVLYLNGDDPATVDMTGNFITVQRTLTDLVERLVANGRQVTLMGAVPEMPWRVADRVETSILFGRPMPDPVTIAEVEARQGRTNAILSKLADSPAVDFVPIAQALCTPECPTHNDTVIYYRDAHHLTDVGAKILLTNLVSGVLTSARESNHE